MKVLPLAVSIICAVTVTALAISCHTCNSYSPGCDLDPARMNRAPDPCPHQDHVCLIINVQERSFTDKGLEYFKLQCGNPSECDQRRSFTMVKYSITMASNCCNTSGCIPALPTLLPDNGTYNGVTCPSCLSEVKNKDCIPQYSMRCRGEEKYCISYHETADGVSLLHSRGCATENFCKKEEMRLFPFDLDKVAACTIVSHEQPLPAGHFLWCPVCFGKELDVSSFLLCAADEDVCLFEATRTLYDGEEQVQYFRRCGMSHECSRRGSISSSKKTMSINTTCCHQSQCHCPEPELPALSDQRNGLICPDCHVSGSHLCLRKSIKRCSGDEDTCIQYTRSMKQDFSVMKEVLYGCASRSFCNAGSSRVLPMGGYGQHITTEVICNGGRRLTIPSSLCYIPALLIVICLQFSPLTNF